MEKLADGQLRRHARAGQERRYAARHPALGRKDVFLAIAAVIRGIVHERRVQYNRDRINNNADPKCPAPVPRGRGDKGAHRRACGVAEVKGEMEDGVGAASLVQEEHVNEAARAEDADNGAEEAREAARHDEEVVVVRGRHERRPDRGEQHAEERPEHDRLPAKDARQPEEDDATDNHTT